MSDTSFPAYMHYGTAAQRGAFTPSPSTGQPIYIWYETDTGATYLYDTSWHQLSGTGASGSFTSSVYVNLQEQQAQNTNAGTLTSGAWRTRVLNTEAADVGGLCSLASNQFTLSAGTYVVSATAPMFAVDRTQLRIQNITDTATVLTGQSNYASSTSPGQGGVAYLSGLFTIGASKALELQQQAQTTSATVGFGAACNFTTEVYAVVELWKVG